MTPTPDIERAAREAAEEIARSVESGIEQRGDPCVRAGVVCDPAPWLVSTITRHLAPLVEEARRELRDAEHNLDDYRAMTARCYECGSEQALEHADDCRRRTVGKLVDDLRARATAAEARAERAERVVEAARNFIDLHGAQMSLLGNLAGEDRDFRKIDDAIAAYDAARGEAK